MTGLLCCAITIAGAGAGQQLSPIIIELQLIHHYPVLVNRPALPANNMREAEFLAGESESALQTRHERLLVPVPLHCIWIVWGRCTQQGRNPSIMA